MNEVCDYCDKVHHEPSNRRNNRGMAQGGPVFDRIKGIFEGNIVTNISKQPSKGKPGWAQAVTFTLDDGNKHTLRWVDSNSDKLSCVDSLVMESNEDIRGLPIKEVDYYNLDDMHDSSDRNATLFSLVVEGGRFTLYIPVDDTYSIGIDIE